MPITIDFCYETITPESAEHGDYSESGFIAPGMWKYPADDYEREQWKPGDLGALVSFAQSLGITEHTGGDWIQSVDPDPDYQTGAQTFYSMHIAGCTASSKARIFKLLTGE